MKSIKAYQRCHRYCSVFFNKTLKLNLHHGQDVSVSSYTTFISESEYEHRLRSSRSGGKISKCHLFFYLIYCRLCILFRVQV